MSQIIAVHHPRIAGRRRRDALTKQPGLGLHPARIPVDGVQVHDRQAKARADAPRQRRLAGAARPENENAFRHGHGSKQKTWMAGSSPAMTILRAAYESFPLKMHSGEPTSGLV